ncbi:MAG: MutT/nudix family protein [Anaerolineae bacterium]|jgi:ADP-ribose pyrophosphatase YjhB (NUDIX family)|nr:MAG: MutT/nudix family protein [Anaerolineae bacterium]
MPEIPRWLEWAREIQALAQTGLHYSTDEYNRYRYERLLQIAAEIASEAARLDYNQVYRLFREPIGYATPRVDVRAAVFQDHRLLLVRERLDGGWTMPGGWADVGDVPSEAAEREAFEEAGFRVKARKVIGVYDANRVGPLELFHAYKIVFLCDILEGQPKPSHETSEVAFFDQDEIPGILSGERTLPRHIADAFRAHCDPSIPTVFD